VVEPPVRDRDISGEGRTTTWETRKGKRRRVKQRAGLMERETGRDRRERYEHDGGSRGGHWRGQSGGKRNVSTPTLALAAPTAGVDER
jgi:hypothetical protein